MLLTEYDEKKHMRTLYREGKEDGYVEGRKVGYQEGEKAGYQEGEKAGYQEGEKAGFQKGEETKLKEQLRKKLSKGKTVEMIADELEEEPDIIHRLMEEL